MDCAARFVELFINQRCVPILRQWAQITDRKFSKSPEVEYIDMTLQECLKPTR